MDGWSELSKDKKEDTIPVEKPIIVARKRVTPQFDRDTGGKKILLYGGASSGKTRATINYFHQKWKENNNIVYWYIDTERGLKKTLQEFPKELDNNIEHFECDNFKDIILALNLILENAQEGDVIVVDMLSTLWEWAQADYTMQVFDSNMTEFFLSRRKELAEKHSGRGVFDGWKDWVGIKLLHNQDFIDILVRQTGADLLCICSAKEVPMNEPGRPPILNPDIFTFVGFAPEGEKHNEHRFDTIIYLWAGEDSWYMKAPKYRGNYDMLRRTITIPPKEFPEI